VIVAHGEIVHSGQGAEGGRERPFEIAVVQQQFTRECVLELALIPAGVGRVPLRAVSERMRSVS
jgi:hypothetical protein